MNSKSQIFSKYLGDPIIAELFSDERLVKNLLRFEIELASAQSSLNIIPANAAAEIKKVLGNLKIDPSELIVGTLSNGMPIISLLEIVRSQLSPGTAKFLHFQTTSQDALDTALVLVLKDSIAAIKSRLERLVTSLRKLSENYGDVECMARTRGQLAVPTFFKYKVAAWLDPLRRQEKRLKHVSDDVLKIQFGGAVGDLSSYNDKGVDLRKAVALGLELNDAESWHTQRDSLCELTNWMAVTSGILGKMGSDILVMSQSEIGELIENIEGGGKSSAMAHKNNPILSEALVALAKLNAGLQSTQLTSLIHTNERDATAWILEWKCIPEIIINTATGLTHTITISEKMKVDKEMMRKNVEKFKKGNQE